MVDLNNLKGLNWKKSGDRWITEIVTGGPANVYLTLERAPENRDILTGILVDWDWEQIDRCSNRNYHFIQELESSEVDLRGDDLFNKLGFNTVEGMNEEVFKKLFKSNASEIMEYLTLLRKGDK